MDDFEDDSGELFNEDTDDNETLMRGGIRKHMCPTCKTSLEYRVEGRFVVRFCKTCDYEEED